MSTLISTDFGELKRPTTRVHAPPGGGSSWSIGGAEQELPPPPPVKGNREPPTPPINVANLNVSSPENTTTPKLNKKKNYCFAIIKAKGDEVILNQLVQNCNVRMTELGEQTCTIFTVNSLLDLPAAAKRLDEIHQFDAILCIGHLSPNQTQSNAFAQSLLQGLTMVSISSKCPVIAGIAFDELSTVLSQANNGYGKEWIDRAINLLNLGNKSICSSSYNGTALSKGQLPDHRSNKEKNWTSNVIPDQYSQAPSNIRGLLDNLRSSLAEHGARGISGLARKFRVMDDDGNRSLSLSEFSKAISEHALQFTSDEIKELFDFFDEDKSGNISYDEFLIGIRGELNDRRRQLVLLAFNIIDVDKSGIIELDDIIARYNADKHPDVISGKKTRNEIFREFLDTFDGGEKDGKVHPQEFIRYYANVSASIDDDDYFELMIRNAWHISGGKGWCENSTCRRVLVTHADGRQSVEEVKNDIGISADNKEAIYANLEKQGIAAKGVEFFGAVDEKNSAPISSRPMTTSSGKRRQHGAGESSIVFG